MENSHIQWTDHTFNPWVGCTKVSEGCKHCYAETRDVRFAGGIHWGKGAPRQRTTAANWRKPLAWNRDAAKAEDDAMEGIISAGAMMPLPPRRPRVFCASLADWLDDEVQIEWLADLLELIHATSNLDWLLLTKRPENWRARIEAALAKVEKIDGDWPSRGAVTPVGEWINEWSAGEAPANVWMGTTVENQAMADERIPRLLEIPAKVRFLSCEPLLGRVQLLRKSYQWPRPGVLGYRVKGVGFDTMFGTPPDRIVPADIHWVICGGESGGGARAMEEAWAESLRAQCKVAGVPFFMKQLGGVRDARGALEQLPEGLRVREFPVEGGRA